MVRVAPLVHVIGPFIANESQRRGGSVGGLLGAQMNQTYRYAAFVDRSVSRYDAASLAYYAAREAWNGTNEDRPGMNAWSDAADTLAYEIEAFYLFAKILLVRIGRLVECYFGPARKCSLDSHDQLVKHIDSYLSTLQLPAAPRSLKHLVEVVKTTISDYRDYEIAHEKSDRNRGLIIPPAEMGPPTIHAVSIVRPDRGTQSSSPTRLIVLLNDYCGEWTRYLTSNSDRCRTPPRE